MRVFSVATKVQFPALEDAKTETVTITFAPLNDLSKRAYYKQVPKIDSHGKKRCLQSVYRSNPLCRGLDWVYVL